MGENTKIEWCDHTFNPWIGCAKVSPGCKHCYAEQLMDKRWGKVNWGPGNPRQRTSAANWKEAEQWNRKAEKERDDFTAITGFQTPINRPRVFVASLADWLDPEVPIEWLADLLDLVRRCPHLDFLMLTKRPELWPHRMNAVYENVLKEGSPATPFSDWLWAWLVPGKAPFNVWVGTSVEDQTRADERIPALLRIPAKVRFLSCEPLLGPVHIEPCLLTSADKMAHEPQFIGNPSETDKVHWVICGGESGPKARHMKVEWARSLRDQCDEWNTAFFMKQMGGSRKPFPEIPGDLQIREFPEGEWRERCKAAIDAAKGGSDE